eukprot:7015967-Pyramimonas_sp.AAC.1
MGNPRSKCFGSLGTSGSKTPIIHVGPSAGRRTAPRGKSGYHGPRGAGVPLGGPSGDPKTHYGFTVDTAHARPSPGGKAAAHDGVGGILPFESSSRNAMVYRIACFG